MTLNEINNMIKEDYLDILENRLRNKHEYVYSTDEDGNDIPVDPVFTEEEIDDEFILYKTELIAEETERLRVENLKMRIGALNDISHIHSELYPNIPNAALYMREVIVENSNHAEAEANLAQYEAKSIELKAAKDAIEYIEKRKAEYPSLEECIHAILDNNLEEIQTRRAAVKAKYPKPE